VENSLIKDIGRSYIVSSLLPAAFFVSLGVLIFRGFVPSIIVQRVIEQDQYYGSQLLLFAALIVWVAFCLYSATDWTVRLYEGYYLPKVLRKMMAKSLRKWQHKKTKKIRKAISYKNQEDMNSGDYFDEYFGKALVQIENLERIMPIDENLVMPTRFGNILLASELYPQEKYHMNGLSLWTRLINVIPDSFKGVMEEKNNQMIFLLNSSLLSYIISGFGFIAGIVNLPCQLFWDSSLCYGFGNLQSSLFGNQRVYVSAVEYLATGIIFLILGYIIYRLSLPAAEGFGLIVRSGFDLYRFELLRQMNYPVPAAIDEEKTQWKRISEYMAAGDKLALEPMKINYFVREELLDGVDPSERKKQKPVERRAVVKRLYGEPPRHNRKL